MMGEKRKHVLRQHLGLDLAGLHANRQRIKEFVARRNGFVRDMPRLPTLVVDPTDQGWQLGGELYSLVDCQPVSELMQDGTQGAERFRLVNKVGVFAATPLAIPVFAARCEKLLLVPS